MPNRNTMVTTLDVARLERLMGHMQELPLSVSRAEDLTCLEDLLLDATVVTGQSIPADVVTMNSRVRLAEPGGCKESEVTLVYPVDLGGRMDAVSVFSPLGQALLGSRTGEVLDVTLPGGGNRQFVVGALMYQPEAAGDYFT